MEQKNDSIDWWRSGAYFISELCRQIDISHLTTYKYIKRNKLEELGEGTW